MHAHWIRRIATVGATLALIAGSALLAETGAQATTSAQATSHNPFGHVDSVTIDSKYNDMDVKGWAIDPDYTSGATTVQILDNGKVVGTTTTGYSRPDVQKVYPKYGPDNGWDNDQLPSPPGRGNNSICATAVNRGAGANTSLGCITVDQTTALSLVGHIDSITQVSPGTYQIAGWALDPSDALSPTVFFLDDAGTWGVWDQQVSAGLPRPDVDRAYPNNGHNHGFDVTAVLNSDLQQAPQPGDKICIAVQINDLPDEYTDTPYCANWPS